MRRRDFQRTTRSGRRIVTRYFLVFVLPREDDGAARLGITVTRKVGKAVRRNRIKRLVREWFRRSFQGLTRWDVVVIAKRSIPDALRVDDVEADLVGIGGALEARWSR